MTKALRLAIFAVLTLSCVSGSVTLADRPLADRPVRTDTPVRSSLLGNSPIADPSVFNYRFQSDLLGPYVNGVWSVESVIQAGGDWRLDASTSTTRTMMLDFRDAVPGSSANPPFQVANVPAMTETKSYLLYGTGKVAGMTGLNSTLITPFVARFAFGGNTYRIWMSASQYPQTNYGLVRCTGVVSPANSQCNHWTIEPSVTQPDGQLKNIAKLVRVSTSRGKTIEIDQGDFYLSFSIDITNP